MSLPRYGKYKESAVEWLGEIPDHWKIKRLKDICSEDKYSFVDGPFGSDLKNDEYTDTGIPLIQLNNIVNGQHILNETRFVSEDKADSLCRHNAFPGDIVIAKMAEPVARAAVVRNDYERYVIVADCIRLAVSQKEVYVPFLVNAINSPFFRANAECLSSGITRLRINLGAVKKLQIALPEREEQIAIANFLKLEIGKINELVAEQERLIALLKEKRQATISHAVTKGLNPDEPMKDSGIEWLGKVPEGWEVSSLRRISVNVQTGGTPSSEPPSMELENGVVWYTPGDFEDSLILGDSTRKISQTVADSGETKLFPSGSVLIVSIGATLGKVGYIQNAASANQQINAVIPAEKIDGYFLAYSLAVKSEVMRYLSNASTIGIMNQEKTKDIWVSVPSLQEQSTITAFLDNETAKIDALVGEARQAIVLLKERRSALISAAVTGKIDVRNFVQTKENQ
ncbi:MAG: restriction endonuclease subunit S [Desulfuromonadaceae bacterium]|nr:restriction endonuclease subunit S [Desulfuromonadaceae bacterium]